MKNYDQWVETNHNPNWPYIPDHPYRILIISEEKVRIKKLKNPKAFITYSKTIHDVYENLEDYNPKKKGKVLIVFDDMIPDMESNKKLKSYCYWIVF